MPTSLSERLSLSMSIARKAMGGQPPQSVVAVGARALAKLEQEIADPATRATLLEQAFRDAILAAKSVFGQPFDPAGLAVLLEETVGGLSVGRPASGAADHKAFDAAATRFLGDARDALDEAVAMARAARDRIEEHAAAITVIRAKLEETQKPARSKK